MSLLTDTDLYARGVETMPAACDAVARGSRGAAVLRSGGVTVGRFPYGPERAFSNNAVLDRDLGPVERIDALDRMEATRVVGRCRSVRRLGLRGRRGHAPISSPAATRSTPPPARWARR